VRRASQNVMKPRIHCVLATTAHAAHAALATAAGRWTLIAAALAGAIALALACIGRRRTGARPGPGRNRDPE
jgi:predicted lysophospholipase L1 biosynthesis ABC-type transport system permease subunit